MSWLLYTLPLLLLLSLPGCFFRPLYCAPFALKPTRPFSLRRTDHFFLCAQSIHHTELYHNPHVSSCYLLDVTGQLNCTHSEERDGVSCMSPPANNTVVDGPLHKCWLNDLKGIPVWLFYYH